MVALANLYSRAVSVPCNLKYKDIIDSKKSKDLSKFIHCNVKNPIRTPASTPGLELFPLHQGKDTW